MVDKLKELREKVRVAQGEYNEELMRLLTDMVEGQAENQRYNPSEIHHTLKFGVNEGLWEKRLATQGGVLGWRIQDSEALKVYLGLIGFYHPDNPHLAANFVYSMIGYGAVKIGGGAAWIKVDMSDY